MVEHKRGRCWAYRFPSKGVLDEAHWLPEQLVKDLDGMGPRHEIIQMKSDQEPSIIAVQKAIQ